MGLGFARLSREAVEGLLERARRVLARPLANLVPPPPLAEKRAVERVYTVFKSLIRQAHKVRLPYGFVYSNSHTRYRL